MHSSASVFLFKPKACTSEYTEGSEPRKEKLQTEYCIRVCNLIAFLCTPLRYLFTLCGAKFGFSGDVAKNRVPTLLHHIHKNGF